VCDEKLSFKGRREDAEREPRGGPFCREEIVVVKKGFLKGKNRGGARGTCL